MFKGNSMFKGALILYALVFFGVAQSKEPQSTRLLEILTIESKKIGLTTDEYLLSSHRFIRQHDKNHNNNDFEIKPISQYQIYHDAVGYIENGEPLPQSIENEIQQLINMQEAKYASGLGINVNKLAEFRQSLAARYNYFLKERGVANLNSKASNSNEEVDERFSVKCRDFCRSGSWGKTYTSLIVKIHYTAESLNIPYYKQFQVDFVDENTNEKIKSEYWVISPTNAWKDGDAPCDCNSDL